MPFCRHCGVEHSESDRFCPSCGRRIERDPDAPAALPVPEPAPPRPGDRLGTVATFEHAFAVAAGSPWRLGLTALLQTLSVVIASVLMGLVVLEATFSTFRPRGILRTGCFRRVNTVSLSHATYSWDGRNYRVRPGCDPIIPHVNAAGLVFSGVLAGVVIGAVAAVGAVALYRRCDRLAGSGRHWPVLPGAAQAVRATCRQIGWSIVWYVAAVVACVIAAIPIVATASTAGGSAGLLILIELAIYAYMAIRWVVPWLVRVYLAWVRMLLDDRPLAIAYTEVPAVGIRSAWAVVGLCIAVGLVIGVVGALITGIAPGLLYPTQLLAGIVESMVYGAFAVAVLRNLTGELGSDPGAGGYEYQAGGSEPGAGGSAG